MHFALVHVQIDPFEDLFPTNIHVQVADGNIRHDLHNSFDIVDANDEGFTIAGPKAGIIANRPIYVNI